MRKLTKNRVHLPRGLFAPSRPLDPFIHHELQAIVDRRSTPTTTAARRTRQGRITKPQR